MKLLHKGREITPGLARLLAGEYDLHLDEVEHLMMLAESREQIDWLDFANGDGARKLFGDIEFPGEGQHLSPKKAISEVQIVAPKEETQEVTTELLHRACEVSESVLAPGFSRDENGSICIDLSNPPSLEDAEESSKGMLDFFDASYTVSSFAAWELASLMFSCVEYFGESFSFSWVSKITGKALSTINTAYRVGQWTHEHYRPAVPYTTARRIITARHIPIKHRRKTMEIAEEFKLTLRDVNKIINTIKQDGVGILYKKDFDPIEDLDPLENSSQNWVGIIFKEDGSYDYARKWSGWASDAKEDYDLLIGSASDKVIFKGKGYYIRKQKGRLHMRRRSEKRFEKSKKHHMRNEGRTHNPGR